MLKLTPAQAAAYEAMKAAEAVYRAERTDEAQAAYRAANAAYCAIAPKKPLFGRACAAGKRQHAEQAARTAAAMARRFR